MQRQRHSERDSDGQVSTYLKLAVANLLVVLDVSVSHPGEELSEILPLVVLPAVPVSFQVGVEALHSVLALLHICGHLREKVSVNFADGTGGAQ